MPQFGLVPCYLSYRNDHHSKQSKYAEALSSYLHQVEQFWNEDNGGIKHIEAIKEEHEVTCEDLQTNLCSENGQEHSVDLRQ